MFGFSSDEAIQTKSANVELLSAAISMQTALPRAPWQRSAQTQAQWQHENGEQPPLGELGLHTEERTHTNRKKVP